MCERRKPLNEEEGGDPSKILETTTPRCTIYSLGKRGRRKLGSRGIEGMELGARREIVCSKGGGSERTSGSRPLSLSFYPRVALGAGWRRLRLQWRH